MKSFVTGLCAIVFGLGLAMSDAEAAKRLGGGGSVGMQRQAAPPPSKAPAAAPAPTPGAPAATPATPPKRSWMGPLAGLAAGIGLAALLSHFGLGEGVAQFLMFALLALVVVMAVRFFLNRRKPQASMYAGATPAPAGANISNFEPVPGGHAPAAAPVAGAAAAAPAMLPGFDVEGFVRQAKLMFVRLQAANDTGNLDDLREFASPEVFAEAQMQIKERGGAMQRTEVEALEAEVLESVQEFGRYVASVRFHGTLREDGGPAEPFDEIWHITKPVEGGRGWTVAGIQQTN